MRSVVRMHHVLKTPRLQGCLYIYAPMQEMVLWTSDSQYVPPLHPYPSSQLKKKAKMKLPEDLQKTKTENGNENW